MGKIYPTEKVSDIFEKLPNGGEMYHWERKVEGENIFYHDFDFIFYKNNKMIKGIYKKTKSNDRDGDEIVETFGVAYSEEKGIYAIDGREVEDWIKNIKFVFQYLNLREESLKGYKATSNRCFIDGIRCYADEARFGGIVIQTLTDQPE